MGYMRKVKASIETVDVPLGVCTRSRMLQKQRMQTQGQHREGDIKEYLELRSRAIEKIPQEKGRAYRRKMAKEEEADATR
jgi:hypothetical protein